VPLQPDIDLKGTDGTVSIPRIAAPTSNRPSSALALAQPQPIHPEFFTTHCSLFTAFHFFHRRFESY
jgi:hypothetical protein